MRLFYLKRIEDASGVSGTGLVAEGVVFDDNTCALRWLTKTPSTALYSSVQDLENIHGHEGKTKIVYLDQLEKTDWNPPGI